MRKSVYPSFVQIVHYDLSIIAHRLIWPETLTTDLRQWMKTSSECKLYPYIVQIVYCDLSLIVCLKHDLIQQQLITSSVDFIDLLVQCRVGGGHIKTNILQVFNKYTFMEALSARVSPKPTVKWGSILSFSVQAVRII